MALKGESTPSLASSTLVPQGAACMLLQLRHLPRMPHGHCHVTTPAPLRKSRSTNAVLEKVDACGLPACITVSRQRLTAGITATRCCPCSCQLHAAVPLACPQACTPDAGFVGSVSCGLSAVTGCAGADGEGVAFFISAMGLRTRLSAPICA